MREGRDICADRHKTIKNTLVFLWADFVIRESLESDKIKKSVKSNRNSGISCYHWSSDGRESPFLPFIEQSICQLWQKSILKMSYSISHSANEWKNVSEEYFKLWYGITIRIPRKKSIVRWRDEDNRSTDLFVVRVYPAREPWEKPQLHPCTAP